MSGSIYGARLKETLSEAIRHVEDLRPLMRLKASDLLASAIARHACELHDSAFLENGETSANFYELSCLNIEARIEKIQSEGLRDPLVDTSFEVVAAEDGDHVILMSFTEHQDWFEDLMSLPGAENFSYWDGTDRPKDVSEEAWALRRRTYQRILARDPHGRPSGCGPTIIFQKPIHLPDAEHILKFITSKDVRAHTLAAAAVSKSWIASYSGTEQDMMRDFVKFRMSRETLSEIEERRKSLEDILPSLDIDILLGRTYDLSPV